MVFTEIRTYNFRNLENGSINSDYNELFLVGENGQGKTNFLEAVYLLCYGSSFRTLSKKALIRFGHESCAVEGIYRDSSRSSGKIRIEISASLRTIEIDEKKISDRKELIYFFPCILFSHDDTEYIAGTNDKRRQFIDQTLCLFDPDYVDTLRKYRKILAFRNTALKEKRIGLLDAYDEQISETGLGLIAKRRQLIEEFGSVFTPLFKEVTGITAGLRIEYRPSWKASNSGEIISSFLYPRRTMDLESGITSTGPHRDACFFKIEEANFPMFASMGQIRVAALTLRIGQAVFFSQKTGKKPLMLFDDALLELDPQKKRNFLDRIPDYAQAFFAFLPDEPYVSYGSGNKKVLSVKEGVIRD
jgi:DNA replication and repair protein RecF